LVKPHLLYKHNKMKKIILYSFSFLLLFTASQTVFADLKQDPSLKILGSSKLKAIKNGVPKSESTFMNKQKVETQVNTMRCWQNGELILAEHKWMNTVAANPILINKKQQKMYVYDYGETFCMYLGG